MPLRIDAFFYALPRPPRSPLFPYTTLFRSLTAEDRRRLNGYVEQIVQKGPNTAALLNELRELVASSIARRKTAGDRKSTRLNSSHTVISYAVFCLKKKKQCADERFGLAVGV